MVQDLFSLLSACQSNGASILSVESCRENLVLRLKLGTIYSQQRTVNISDVSIHNQRHKQLLKRKNQHWIKFWWIPTDT